MYTEKAHLKEKTEINKKDARLDGAMFKLKTVMRNNGGDADHAIARIMYWSPYSNRAKLEEAAKIIKSSSSDKKPD